MQTSKNGSTVKERHNSRVNWLAEHPEVWRKSERDLVEILKQQGLIAPTTYFQDVRTERLIEQARKVRKQHKQRRSRAR